MHNKKQYVDVDCEIIIKFRMSVDADFYPLTINHPKFIENVIEVEGEMMKDRNALNFLLDSPRIDYTITPVIKARLIEEKGD